MNSVDQAKKMLQAQPLTRAALSRKLCLSQQRVSEIILVLSPVVIGHVPPPGKGRPAPVYSLDPAGVDDHWQEAEEAFDDVELPPRGEYAHVGRVNSVWQLGAA